MQVDELTLERAQLRESSERLLETETSLLQESRSKVGSPVPAQCVCCACRERIGYRRAWQEEVAHQLHAELQSSRQATGDLSASLQRQAAEHEQLRQSVQRLEQRLVESEAEIAGLTADLSVSQVTCRALEEQVRLTLKLPASHRPILTAQRSGLQALQSHAAEMVRSAQSESQEARCNALEMQWRAELDRGSAAEARAKELSGLLQLTQLELQCTQDEVASAKAEAARLNERLAHQMVDSDVFRTQASTLDSQVDAATKQAHELAAELRAANETIQTTSAELALRAATAEGLQNALHKATESEEYFKTRHHELELRLESSERLTGELNELRTLLIDTEHRLVHTQKELADSRDFAAMETSAQCRDLVLQLHEQQGQVSSMQEKVGALEEALESVYYARALEVKELSERNDALSRDVLQARELKRTIAQLEAASEEAAAEYSSKLDQMRQREAAMEVQHEHGLQALRAREEQFESECLRLTSDLQSRARKLQAEAAVLHAEHHGMLTQACDCAPPVLDT
jgi:chromosome segregation ATPase